MIEKVDSTLKAYLLKMLGDPSDTELDFSFALPNKEWLKGAKSSKNWINIYLLELKENVELRRNDPQRNLNGTKVEDQKPPLYVDLYYLITFYNNENQSVIEHRYLEATLLALYDFPNLAANFISNDNTIVKQISLELFPKPFIDEQSGYQLWSAIDQDARPYISLKVTLPLESKVVTSDEIVQVKSIGYEALNEVHNRLYLHGRVVYKNGSTTNAIEGATIKIKEEGGGIIDQTMTDGLGRFEFEALKNEEKMTVVVDAAGYSSKEIELKNILQLSNRSITIVMEKM